jgi:sulfatase modifying factor 1
MQARRLLVVGALLTCGTAACTLLYPLGYLGPGGPETGDVSVPSDGGPLDGGPLDAQLDGSNDDEEASVVDESSTPGCPDGTTGGGGSFCIDTVEVTGSAYKVFWEATDGGLTGAPPECAWKQVLTPPPMSGSNIPVAGVDWCDAFLYCASAHERLCGALGDGGSVPPPSRGEATSDEWMYACSNGGTRTYPYGNSYDASACNGHDYRAEAGPVGEEQLATTCRGGFANVLNMSGNVAEWENSCSGDGSAPATDSCGVRGGSYQSLAADLQCAISDNRQRDAALPFVGFRCCADRQ